MASDIDVINSALNKLGEPTITSVADNNRVSRLANRDYPIIRDALLRQYDWNFATRRASLAADAEAPEWGFSFQYPLPSEFLRLIMVRNSSDREWRIEGRFILTDLSAPLEILYVKRVAVDDFDPAFYEALAQLLAMEWAEAITQTTSVADQMATFYRNKLQVARTADGQEDREQNITASGFIDARDGVRGV